METRHPYYRAYRGLYRMHEELSEALNKTHDTTESERLQAVLAEVRQRLEELETRAVGFSIPDPRRPLHLAEPASETR